MKTRSSFLAWEQGLTCSRRCSRQPAEMRRERCRLGTLGSLECVRVPSLRNKRAEHFASGTGTASRTDQNAAHIAACGERERAPLGRGSQISYGSPDRTTPSTGLQHDNPFAESKPEKQQTHGDVAVCQFGEKETRRAVRSGITWVLTHLGSKHGGEYIRLVWEIATLKKSVCEAGDDEIGAAPGRSRTRNSHRKELRHVPAGLGASAKTAQMWLLRLARKSEAHVWLKANILPLANDMQKPWWCVKDKSESQLTSTLITSSHSRRNSRWYSGSGMERKRLSAKSQNSHPGRHHECVLLNHQVGCTERSQKARTNVVRRTVREELNCCGDPRPRKGRKEVREPVQCGYGCLAEKHAEQSDVQTHLLERDERLAWQGQLRESGDGSFFLRWGLHASGRWRKSRPTVERARQGLGRGGPWDRPDVSERHGHHSHWNKRRTSQSVPLRPRSATRWWRSNKTIPKQKTASQKQVNLRDPSRLSPPWTSRRGIMTRSVSWHRNQSREIWTSTRR